MSLCNSSVYVLYCYVVVECEDYGGPQKEFFTIFLRELSDVLIKEGHLHLVGEYVERRYYYFFGLVVGE